ncbi:MAG: hypothetical protein HKN75_11430, partial [Bacteroidia bacterium]|nr:hypothetical protein [Bacteroidia bacterium]
PVAICAKLISQGKYNAKGVQIPLDAELYNPVLDELETLGIKFKESIQSSEVFN